MIWLFTSDTFRGREPGADGHKQLLMPPALLQDTLRWVCVWTAESGVGCYCWFTRVMAWITPLHNTCSDEHAMSEVLHKGYTLLKDHRLANLVTAEHRSLLDILDRIRLARATLEKSPWTPFGLRSMLLQSIMDSTVTSTLRALKLFFPYSALLEKENSPSKCWSFLACSSNCHWQ